MDVAISIVVTFLLTLANGYFSASELAVVSAKRAILEPEAVNDRVTELYGGISRAPGIYPAAVPDIVQ